MRHLAEEIAGDQPLTDLLQLDQTRYVALLQEGERVVAEMSLDEVVIPAANGPVRAYEVEVELLPGGTLADLGVLERVFADKYHLAAQPQSKFERALRLAGIVIAGGANDTRVRTTGATTVVLARPPPPPPPGPIARGAARRVRGARVAPRQEAPGGRAAHRQHGDRHTQSAAHEL